MFDFVRFMPETRLYSILHRHSRGCIICSVFIIMGGSGSGREKAVKLPVGSYKLWDNVVSREHEPPCKRARSTASIASKDDAVETATRVPDTPVELPPDIETAADNALPKEVNSVVVRFTCKSSVPSLFLLVTMLYCRCIKSSI